jgi:D-Tyr-tRNAtyr deacylase
MGVEIFSSSFLSLFSFKARTLCSHCPVEGSLVSSIKQGYLLLVGICKDDTAEDIEYISRKILSLRFGDDDDDDDLRIPLLPRAFVPRVHH